MNTNLIISGEVGPVTAPAELRKLLCVLKDAKNDKKCSIFVSSSHQSRLDVQSYVERVQRIYGRDNVSINPSSLEEVAALYTGTKIEAGQVRGMEMAGYILALLDKGAQLKVSDIHIRYSAHSPTSIWMRVHHDMRWHKEEPRDFGLKLLSAIYNTSDIKDSNFTISEMQDAVINRAEHLPKDVHGVRIATMPTGEQGAVMVLRMIYDIASDSHDLIDLGFAPDSQEQVKRLLARPFGVNIISGPTGSGKSTTLIRTLNSKMAMSHYRRNLITIEDPVEGKINGAIQCAVTNAGSAEERREAFAGMIRGAMRSDPDDLMVSEIRDEPTAQAALRAALTGHSVWTTLHAISPIGILVRLIDMGVEMNMIADPNIVSGLISQRLIKLLCPECRVPLLKAHRLGQMDEDLYRRVADVIDDLEQVYVTGNGKNRANPAEDCPCCHGTGVIGRTVVEEIIIPTYSFYDFIRADDRKGAFAYWRAHGGVTIGERAIEKIRQGLVDPASAEDTVGLLAKEHIARGSA